jgi:hypothetical protein
VLHTTQKSVAYREPAKRRLDLILIKESKVGVGFLSEDCFFIPKGSFHLLLLIAIVLALTRRDLVVATGRGLAQRAVHNL